MATSTKDFGGIIQAVYDPTSQALNVNIQGSGTPTLPSVVRLTDGTNYLTTSAISGKTALDVSIANMPEILITDSTDSIKVGNGSGTYLAINADGSTNTNSLNSLVTVAYDSIYQNNTSGTIEVYTYKKNGSTVATVTVTYTDVSKNTLVSVVRS